jgi:lipopolysaccharide transport system ATP-binding protein
MSQTASGPAIVANDLGKRYRLGHSVGSYRTLRDQLAGIFRSAGPESENSATAPYIWALKNVSFEAAQGDVLGIIGKNGAGKSTLLKILSRVTSPTTGGAVMHGRVGSLLEVGTGFHPELTGRENVFLNGAIMGEKRADIRRKFDEIVAFAEVEKFIDTPVKHYSSGMYVRLAFAVAAFMELEILIVDEALAVGDAAFQKKCLGRMGDAAREGRTILFVSHSMPALENLCNRVIWVNGGQIVADGEPRRVIADYVASANSAVVPRAVGKYTSEGHRRGTGEVQFAGFRLLDSDGEETNEFEMGETIIAEVEFEAHAAVDNAVFSFSLFDHSTQTIVTTWVGRREPRALSAGERGIFRVILPENFLRARRYYFSLGVTNLFNNDIPYDIWSGGGTEFTVLYPDDLESLDLLVGNDYALVTLPIRAEVEVQG